MGKARHTAEQIVGKLREAEVLLGKGMSMEEMLRQLGISDATYYRWPKEYGGLRVDQAKRLKELEQENSKLRKVIADLTMEETLQRDQATQLTRIPTTCTPADGSSTTWTPAVKRLFRVLDNPSTNGCCGLPARSRVNLTVCNVQSRGEARVFSLERKIGGPPDCSTAPCF